MFPQEGISLEHTFPGLASELREGLTAIGESALAGSIGSLKVYGRCACKQRECGTFYTRPKLEWEGQHLKQVIPRVDHLLAIDICDDAIVCIEFLWRQDVVKYLDDHGASKSP